MKESLDHFFLRLSPSIRFRMMAKDEVDKWDNDEASIEVLEKMTAQYTKIETERFGLVRACLIYIVVLFLLKNGSDFSLPFFKVEIGDIPAAFEIALVGGSVCFFFLIFKILDGLNHAAMIDILIARVYGGSNFRHELKKAQFFPNSTIYFMFRKNYDYFNEDKITPGRASRFISGLFVVIFGVFLFVFMISPLCFFVYLAINYNAESNLESGVKYFALAVNALAVLCYFAANLSLPHKHLYDS